VILYFVPEAQLLHYSDRLLEGSAADTERISAIAGQFNGLSATFASVAASLKGVQGNSLCVLIDQFEELFRYAEKTSRDEADLFIDLIQRAATEKTDEAAPDAVDLRLIITMRSEFLGECARFAGFAETINRTQYLVPRMHDDGLMRAVRRPAQMFGGVFNEALAERLIASVRGREDELPLLQHGLMSMWDDAVRRARPNATVTVDGSVVEEAGGLANLLSDHADAVMASVAPDQRSKQIVEAVFRALTDVNAEGAAIRRPCSFKNLCAVAAVTPEELRPILDAFRAQGVSFLTPYASEPIEQKKPIEVSHEALIRCWRKIGPGAEAWLLKEFRDGLRWRTLVFEAESFAANGSSYLSESATEAHAVWLAERNETWSERYGGGWPRVVTLVEASRGHWQREREVAIANQKRLQITQSRHLAVQGSQRRALGDAGAAVLLALEALPDALAGTDRPYVPEAEFQLDGARRDLREQLVLGHKDAVYSAAFSPDCQRIVTASKDKTARVWDAATGQLIGEPLRGHSGDVRSAAFSPDGQRIVTASKDKTARIWDAATGQPIGEPLKGHEFGAYSAAFSPDGARIVTASDDRTARVWDAATGQPIGEPLKGHTDVVRSATFSPDGQRIVTASSDNTARIWDAATGQPIGELKGHDDGVDSAAFSPDGKRIVTASRDKTAQIWDTFADTQALVSRAKADIPRCLTPKQRKAFYLPPEPPQWCIELEKWPFNTPEWKRWLRDARAGKNPPLPTAP
jgi:WD domain, G-beta repeat